MKSRNYSDLVYMPDYAQLVSLILADTLMLVSISSSVVGALFGVLAMRFFSRRMVRKAYQRGQEDFFVSRSQAEALARQYESELLACRNALGERTSAVAFLESQVRESAEFERKYRELKIELSDKDSLIESLRMEIEMLRSGTGKFLASSGLDFGKLESVVHGLRQGIDQLHAIVQQVNGSRASEVPVSTPKPAKPGEPAKQADATLGKPRSQAKEIQDLDAILSGTEAASEALPIKRQRELLP